MPLAPSNNYQQQSDLLFRSTLLEVFSNNRANWITWTNENGHKNIVTHANRISDERLIDLWVDPLAFIGLRFGHKTRLLIIDIDSGSHYRSTEAIARIKTIFEKRGIILHICRSSSTSQGIHLIAIFDRPVSIKRVGRLAVSILEHHGFNQEPGQLEIYPGPQNPRQAIRLPFQQGFALLDDDLNVQWTSDCADKRGTKFNWLIENQYSPYELIKWRIRYRSSTTIKRRKLGNFNEERYIKGKRLYHTGLTRRKSRHSSLKQVAYYLYLNGLGPGFESERAHKLEKWLEAKHNGLSQDWLSNPRSVKAEITRICQWRSSTSTANPTGYGQVNKARTDQTRIKLINAVIDLKSNNGLFKKNGTINLAAVERQSGVSHASVLKHKALIEREASRAALFAGFGPLQETLQEVARQTRPEIRQPNIKPPKPTNRAYNLQVKLAANRIREKLEAAGQRDFPSDWWERTLAELDRRFQTIVPQASNQKTALSQTAKTIPAAGFAQPNRNINNSINLEDYKLNNIPAIVSKMATGLKA